MCVPYSSFLKFCSFIFRERGREGEREEEKHHCVVASHAPPIGDPVRNPGMCPDWESNQRPFGLQAGTPSTEPHQPGLCPLLLRVTSFIVSLSTTLHCTLAPHDTSVTICVASECCVCNAMCLQRLRDPCGDALRLSSPCDGWRVSLGDGPQHSPVSLCLLTRCSCHPLAFDSESGGFVQGSFELSASSLEATSADMSRASLPSACGVPFSLRRECAGCDISTLILLHCARWRKHGVEEGAAAQNPFVSGCERLLIAGS